MCSFLQMCISLQMCRTGLMGKGLSRGCRSILWCSSWSHTVREGGAPLLPSPQSAQAICSTDSLGNSCCISPNDSVRDSNQLPAPLPIICAFFLPTVIFLPSVRSDYMIKGGTKGREQRGKRLKEERERLWALGALPALWELPWARWISLGAGLRGDPPHLLRWAEMSRLHG